ncbi:polysaccharide pyruvyl transferase family protein [Niallia sp. 01092]|uniref:polysaccharide pyruvyl transferase family protein n=1 Tax=Niallia sp. 01092 TaxID=3457759 RepID=UPI003FD555D3
MLKKRIRSFVEYFKINIYNYILYIIMNARNPKLNLTKNQKKIVIFSTPVSGNLGDQAIAYAQKNFIETYYSDYIYIELALNEVMPYAKNLKNILTNKDILFINGGGNMGDEYYNEDYTRRFIIKYFKESNIISFPQTIHFSETTEGRKTFEKTKDIFNNNIKFQLVARESRSLEIMKNNFNSKKVLYTPDIVLSLDKRRPGTKREGAIICLRDDLEGKLDNNFKKVLEEVLKRKFEKTRYFDTDIDAKLGKETREKELNVIWNAFAESEVVVTDRLHGMIFCAITGTPCIAFKNYNHKIQYSYIDWLSKIPNIKFVDSVQENVSEKDVEEMIDEIRGVETDESFYKWIIKQYQPIFNHIEKLEGKKGAQAI